MPTQPIESRSLPRRLRKPAADAADDRSSSKAVAIAFRCRHSLSAQGRAVLGCGRAQILAAQPKQGPHRAAQFGRLSDRSLLPDGEHARLRRVTDSDDVGAARASR